MADLFELKEVIQVLMDLANDVEENYKQHLVQSGRYTTEYALLDSITTRVSVSGTEYSVVMNLNDYWKYVEDDTKPHFPPPSAIQRWVEIKPVIPKPDDNGRIPTPRQLAYLIGRKISIFGTKGSHDLERTKDAVLPMYRKRLEAALGHDVSAYIKRVMREG